MRCLFLSCLAVIAPLANAYHTRRAAANLTAIDARRKINYTVYEFDQLIDHFPNSSRYVPHTNDTFKQRYVFDHTYYKPGGPVFLYISGETGVESRESNLQTGIIQILAEATNGLGIILENRYYGKSYPFDTSTTDKLRFLTTEQTIADNAYFATHVTESSFAGVDANLAAPSTPWILYGGSLAGAQTAYSLHEYGGDNGVFWGGIGSSATTKAKLAYVEWYDPIQKFGPQDAVGSINAIVDKIDQIFDSQHMSAIIEMKSIFGLEDLGSADFAQVIAWPLGGPFDYPTNTWQELGWANELTGSGSDDFWSFTENITNMNAPENITQVDYALSKYTNGETWTNLGNYANYIKNHILPLATGPINSTNGGFSTQNESYWADPANSGERSYIYTTCTESGGYQVARPYGPSLISRQLTLNYTQQWCTWAFPPGNYNSIPSTPDLESWNRYGGYNVSGVRLAHIDGDQDVWLDLCYHSDDASTRLTSNVDSAYQHPQLLITGAGHHWDSYGILDVDAEPQFIRAAHKWEIRIVKEWLEEFEAKRG